MSTTHRCNISTNRQDQSLGYAVLRSDQHGNNLCLDLLNVVENRTTFANRQGLYDGIKTFTTVVNPLA